MSPEKSHLSSCSLKSGIDNSWLLVPPVDIFIRVFHSGYSFIWAMHVWQFNNFLKKSCLNTTMYLNDYPTEMTALAWLASIQIWSLTCFIVRITFNCFVITQVLITAWTINLWETMVTFLCCWYWNCTCWKSLKKEIYLFCPHPFMANIIAR